MKIGIVGGTFNPIHLGHLMLGEYAYNEFQLDEIWFMPNGNPPHKIESEIRNNSISRMNMIQIAIKDTSYFRVEPYEIERSEISYSYETLEYFKNKFPNNQYYFILGTDSLLQLETWKHPEKLLKSCHILIACRDTIEFEVIEQQIQYLSEKYLANIYLLKMPLLEVSSSEIRNRIVVNQSIKYIVPDKVIDYIKDNQLYSKEKNYGN